MSARSDESLSSVESDGLSYTMKGVDGLVGDEVDSSKVISDKLKGLSSLIDVAIENDVAIRQQDDDVIRRAFLDGVEGVGGNYDSQLIKEHLSRILMDFFSYRMIRDCMFASVVFLVGMNCREGCSPYQLRKKLLGVDAG